MAGNRPIDEALVELQAELERFKSAKAALDAAHAQARDLLDQWEAMRSATEEALKALHEDVKSNSKAAAKVTLQFAELGPRLSAVAEAVERAGFPARLDKLDTTLGTVALAVQTMQGRLESIEKNLADRILHAQQETNAAIHRCRIWLVCVCALLAFVGGGCAFR